MTPTATQCVDGKRHRWQLVHQGPATHHSYGLDDGQRISWCAKCGSLTEFYKASGRHPYVRYTNGSGKGLHIEIPQHLRRKKRKKRHG